MGIAAANRILETFEKRRFLVPIAIQAEAGIQCFQGISNPGFYRDGRRAWIIKGLFS